MDLYTIANRILDIDLYEAMDTGTTPEMVIDELMSNPGAVINYLLDTIDELMGV